MRSALLKKEICEQSCWMKNGHLHLTTTQLLPLQEGYVLMALEVSEKKGVVNFVLSKNGKPVYASAVSIGDTFVYKVNDVPVILVHLANAMRGEDLGFAEVDGDLSDQQ